MSSDRLVANRARCQPPGGDIVGPGWNDFIGMIRYMFQYLCSIIRFGRAIQARCRTPGSV